MANKIFYIILIALILGSVGATFYKIVWQKDYQIVAEVSCDPTLESCFYYAGVECDPVDTECVPEDPYDYKLISKKAANIYTCEQTEEKVGCNEELSCLEGEEDCSYTLCDPNNLGEDEACSEPVVEVVVDEAVDESGAGEMIEQ